MARLSHMPYQDGSTGIGQSHQREARHGTLRSTIARIGRNAANFAETHSKLCSNQTQWKSCVHGGASLIGKRACVVNCLAAIKAQIGSLDRIKQVLAVHGLVNSTLDCGDQALAMNGASDFVVDIFGDVGRHVRTAAGVASLPMGFAASVYMIVEVE